MNKNIKQYAMIIMAIGALLILAGCYQAYNPVLAVSAHDDIDDVKRMLATSTFNVDPTPRVPPCTAPDGLGYGDIDGNGYVTHYDAEYIMHYVVYGSSEYPLTDDQKIRADVNVADGITGLDATLTDNYAAHIEGYDSFIACNPPSAAQINDATDTLNFDKTTYHPGDIVTMTAWGENTGEMAWIGEVTFTVTKPDNTEYTTEATKEVTVAADASETVTNSFTLPSDATIGTWSIQSKWIDESGTIHAMTTIDLGTEEIFGIPTLAILLALLGILVLIAGFSRRKG